MVDEFMTWLVTEINPMWVLLMFPMIIGLGAFSVWRENRRQKKLEANPNRMTNAEYKTFNRKRFSK